MLKEIIKHFRAKAQSRFNPSPDGSREKYYEGWKDAYNDCADVLERYLAKYSNGWHPGSELPPEDGEYIVKKEWGPARADLFYSKFENGKWSTPQVKWWCYPPKEE
jgi:hypothetical protein